MAARKEIKIVEHTRKHDGKQFQCKEQKVYHGSSSCGRKIGLRGVKSLKKSNFQKLKKKLKL